MMGPKGGGGSAPNYAPIAMSSIEAAQIQAKTSDDQLKWAKEQYADQAPYTKAFMTSMTNAQDANIQSAKDAQARLEKTYYPIEDKFAKEAQDYNTPARAAERSAAAQADVATAYAGQRQAALQSLESFGIDPSQTRYGALDLGARISQAAAQAAAGTTSRQQSEATGLALQGEAINIGRGYPGQVAQSYGTAINAGSGGVNAGLNTANTYGNLMGTPTQWGQLSNQSRQTATGALQAQGQYQLGQQQINASAAGNTMSGIGGMVGAVAGVAAIAI